MTNENDIIQKEIERFAKNFIQLEVFDFVDIPQLEKIKDLLYFSLSRTHAALLARQEADQRVAEAVEAERERVKQGMPKKKIAQFGRETSWEMEYANGYNQALADLQAKIK